MEPAWVQQDLGGLAPCQDLAKESTTAASARLRSRASKPCCQIGICSVFIVFAPFMQSPPLPSL